MYSSSDDPQDKRKLEEDARRDREREEQRERVQEEARRRQEHMKLQTELRTKETELREKETELAALDHQVRDLETIHDSMGRQMRRDMSRLGASQVRAEEQKIRDITRDLENVKREESDLERELHRHEGILRDEKRSESRQQETMTENRVKHERTERAIEDKRRDRPSLEHEIHELKREIEDIRRKMV